MILLSAGTVAQAQQKAAISNPIKGFWVVESNISSPQKQLVKFYNTDQQLIYEELYDRKLLNYSRKHVRNLLDSALVTVLNTKNEYGEAVKIASVITKKHKL